MEGAIFVVGGLYFYALLVFAMVVLGACLHYEKYFWAFVSVGIVAMVLKYFGDVNLFSLMYAHPWLSLAGLLVYMALGTVYSVFKWWDYSNTKARELKRSFLSANNKSGDDVPAELKAQWTQYATERLGLSAGEKLTLNVDEYKGKIFMWIMYWPPSLLVTLLNDPIRKLANYCYEMVRGTYIRIVDRAFASLNKDMVSPEELAVYATKKEAERVAAMEAQNRRGRVSRDL